jgi:hypothetical protein
MSHVHEHDNTLTAPQFCAVCDEPSEVVNVIVDVDVHVAVLGFFYGCGLQPGFALMVKAPL